MLEDYGKDNPASKSQDDRDLPDLLGSTRPACDDGQLGVGPEIGNNYPRVLLALAFQGFFLMVCVEIYAVLVNDMIIATNIHSTIFSITAYTVLLCFAMMKKGSLAKSIFHAH